MGILDQPNTNNNDSSLNKEIVKQIWTSLQNSFFSDVMFSLLNEFIDKKNIDIHRGDLLAIASNLRSQDCFKGLFICIIELRKKKLLVQAMIREYVEQLLLGLSMKDASQLNELVRKIKGTLGTQ